MPNFLVESQYGNTSVNMTDTNPSSAAADFLTNARYGAGFPSANIDLAGTWADWAAYCDAAGIWLSPQLDQQTEAQQALQNLVQLSNSAVVWSGGLLKVIPYGDAPLSATYWIVVVGGTIGGLDTLSLTFSSADLGTVTVSYQAQPANVNTDTSDASGPMGKLAQQINGTPQLTQYGITAGVGALSTVIRLGGADQSVTITASAVVAPGSDGAETFTIYGPFGRSWTPVTTVQYSLDDDDFIVEASYAGMHLGVTPGSSALRQGAGPITGGFLADPVQVTRTSPADVMNYVAIECLDRAYGYNTQIVEVFDQASVDLYGVRKDTSIKGRAICDPALCGQVVAQILLQRNLAYLNTYSWRCGWSKCLLEPMDIVAISDSYLGLENQPVQITSVTEDEEGTLTFTAIDWLGAVGAPSTAPQMQAKQGFAATASQPNYQNPAPPAATPFILEPTPQLLQAQGIAQPQIIIGLAAAGPIWGGAQVHVSIDNESYAQEGTFIGRSTIGVSTADLPADGTSLTVDLSASGGALASNSPLAAANGVSLCALRYPGRQLEFLSYTTATLVSGNVYTLSGLYRGLYGTPQHDQPAGAQFLYLGKGQYYAQTLPPQYVGHNLWLKLPSFNLVGGGGQSLAQVPAYEYTPLGAQLNPLQITARFAMAIEAGATSAADAEAPIEHE
jgi:Putative phage tail protein